MGLLLHVQCIDFNSFPNDKFQTFQTQRLCRRQLWIWWKWQNVLQKGRKQCGKKEKLVYTSNFSFSHNVFKRLVLQTCKNKGLFGEGLTIYQAAIFNPLLHKILILTHQQQTAFENIVGKEEIARNEQFLRFPQCFLLNQKIITPFVNI